MRGHECKMGKRSANGTGGTKDDPGPSGPGEEDGAPPRRPPWPRVEPENDRVLAGMLGCSALVGLGLWILLALALF